MKIVVEIIFKSNEARMKCFAHVFIRNKDNALDVVYQAVRDKMRDYNNHVEIEEVIAAGKDITDKILELDNDYHKHLINRLDSELPF